VVALLGVVAVVIALVVVLGRGGGGGGSSSATSTNTTAASGVPATAPTAAAAPVPGVPTGVAAWFRAAGTLPCVPGTLIGGAVQAERCTDGAVTGRFYELVTARRAALDLAAVAREFGVTEQAWSDGAYITYTDAGRTVVLWSYTGHPYLGSAAGPTASSWWITTGRVRA
jgi:hypothetical protein